MRPANICPNCGSEMTKYGFDGDDFWCDYCATDRASGSFDEFVLVDVDELIIARELPPDHPGYELGFSTHSDDTPVEPTIASLTAEVQRLQDEKALLNTRLEFVRADRDAYQAFYEYVSEYATMPAWTLKHLETLVAKIVALKAYRA